jgi:hypothetical protein
MSLAQPRLARVPFAALLALIATMVVASVVACAESGPSQGVTNPQAPNRCLPRGSNCAVDGDCCTLWCVNGTCVRKNP